MGKKQKQPFNLNHLKNHGKENVKYAVEAGAELTPIKRSGFTSEHGFSVVVAGPLSHD